MPEELDAPWIFGGALQSGRGGGVGCHKSYTENLRYGSYEEIR